MKETKIESKATGRFRDYGDYGIENLVEFDSLNEFYKYICETPVNESFRWEELCSSRKEKPEWYATKSYEEATELFKGGWSEGAKELTQKLKFTKMDTETTMVAKNFLSVCGYQAIVPLYLNGVPNNMMNKRMVATKQKVITINKLLSASARISSERMKEEAVKTFQIINKIEQSGIRVNLNLMISTGHVCAKIRLKSSGERLNISKLAFPLVHPSMFRRLYFRFIEVYPTIPKCFTIGYGKVPSENDFKALCKENEIVLPTLLGTDMHGKELESISVQDLLKRL